MPLILKRLTVWLLEALVSTLLFGVLFGALSSPDLSTFASILPGAWALAFGVGAILFLHGYYVTTALAGVVWRSQKPWLYPAIAATLFVIHTHIVFFRLKPDLSPSGRTAELPFLAGGACIAFACAFGGNWLLRKWNQSSSNGRAPGHRGIVPGSAGV
ncbi:MAG TPA: hypothetical protein VG675_13525 [Bryobacteraceae bacterium]|nr:hypothetical protein [Bryobacteraceae bacterium]